MIPSLTLWEAIAPHLGRRVVLHGSNDQHAGILRRILIHRDGSATVDFTDDATITLQPIRTAR